MGYYEYAVISVPSSPYEEDVRELLGALFDVGVNVAGCTGAQVAQAFVASGLAWEFEQQNPVYVAGMSSYDLLGIMLPWLPCEQMPAIAERLERTPDFWTGWALAHYQAETGRSYASVFQLVSYDEVRSMYWPLHEAPESKFVTTLDEWMRERAGATKLRRMREAAGLSQSQLANLSGVKLRNIQMYEQRNKDINKATATNLYKLARALRCPMESLMER